jgi:hypothetical protein
MLKRLRLIIFIPLLLVLFLATGMTVNALPHSTKSIEARLKKDSLSENHPITKAIDQDQGIVVLRWLQKGNHPNSAVHNQMKERLLERAVMKGSVECAALLLKVYKVWGLKPSLTDSRGTPLIVSIAGLATPLNPRAKRYEKTIERMIHYFPETLMQQDRAYIGEGRMAIHQAAAVGNVKLVEFLVSKGNSIEQKSLSGETPLHFAARSGSDEVVRFLINSRANKNAQAKHTQATPLMLAAEAKQDSTVKLLIALGADRSIQDTFGKTVADRILTTRSTVAGQRKFR